MSIFVKSYEWQSAEECLQWLFENHEDMKIYGSIHVWQESFATLGNGNLAGSYRSLYPELLKNRGYKAFFVDNSIGICFYDEIFADSIPNRSYPEKTYCVKIKTPFI